MKKQEVIDLMMKDGNKDKFHHIKMAEPKERKAPAKKQDTHKMPDGTVMTGKKHTAKSKSVKKEIKSKKKKGMDPDDYSYLGITNEEADEISGIKKK